jgi:AAA family ATP:ADP antiporter
MFKDKEFRRLFLLMIAIISLLSTSYAILRSARNALAVADLGGGAGSIPWFELCGTMPGAVLMTFGLTWLLNRFSLKKVFFITLTIFVGFFVLFTFGAYPLLFKAKLTSGLVPKICSMLFFVMAELWKIALITVLFWGFINQHVVIEKAKRFYAPLMFGSSVGTMLASPLVSLCTSDALSKKSWSVSLALMTGIIVLLSLVTWQLFSKLWSQFSTPSAKNTESTEEKPHLSVFESLRICFSSPYLLLLAWLTMSDYIAYGLGEIVFLDVLKKQFPDPRIYCDYMGKLALWNGLLTAFSALVVTPYILKRFSWTVASIVTPVCLLVTEGAFFFALWHPSYSENLPLLVGLGTVFFCFVRAAKFTLFDASKEISFILLPPLEKMQGKLVIDGMCARLGRGGASLFSLVLIQLCGSVGGTVAIGGSVALTIAASCTIATSRLGKMIEKLRLQKE